MWEEAEQQVKKNKKEINEITHSQQQNPPKLTALYHKNTQHSAKHTLAPPWQLKLTS